MVTTKAIHLWTQELFAQGEQVTAADFHFDDQMTSYNSPPGIKLSLIPELAPPVTYGHNVIVAPAAWPLNLLTA